MWDRWIGRRVDLRLLSEFLRQFFEERNFRSLVEEKSENEIRVIAVQNRVSSDANILGTVNVFIRGDSEDFRVEFVGGSDSRLLTRLGVLATLFGGGFFLLRDLKSSEAQEKLEKEFWRFVDEAVGSSKDIHER